MSGHPSVELAFAGLAKRGLANQRTIAWLTGIAEPTLARWRHDTQRRPQAKRLMRLTALARLVAGVTLRGDALVAWLEAPNLYLASRAPAALLRSERFAEIDAFIESFHSPRARAARP